MRCYRCGAAKGAGAACGWCAAAPPDTAPGPPAGPPAVPAPPPHDGQTQSYAAAPSYAPPLPPYPTATAPVVTAPAPYAYVPPAYHLDAAAAAQLLPPPARRAGWTTFAAIAVGALIQWVVGLLLDGETLEQEALVRYGIVTVLAVYGVVGYLVVKRIEADAHPLRWHGPWGVWPSAAFGFALGGGAGWLLLRALSNGGVEGGDRYTVLLVSERTVPYIAAALLISCVAAPLVEEALFRGLLLESWLGHGEAVALLGSGALFAAWHLMPAQLPYYTIAGTLLGLLYLRHGLSCSIAAHVAFNGTLVVAAVLFTFAPGPVVRPGHGLTLHAPSGWHTIDGAPGVVYGPSNAVIVVLALPDGNVPETAGDLAASVAAGGMAHVPGFRVRTDTVRTVDLPSGEAVRMKALGEGLEVDLALLPGDDVLHLVMLRGAGSARARADFDRVLDSIVLR